MPNSSFENISHEAHETWYDTQYPNDEARLEAVESWKKGIDQPTISFWLQHRMWALLDGLILPTQKWLTVGDGYGLDGHYLETKKAQVMTTDISDTFLPLAKAHGFIRQFSIENAEHLSFENDSFDYALCKESYHHFPRPQLAVYELLRVASKGVILIEPNDPISRMPLLLGLVNLADRIHPRWVEKVWKNRFSFETVGNYVFKLSTREMEKVAMGLNLPAMAYKGINNSFYQSSTGSELVKDRSPAFQKIKFKIRLANLVAWLGIVPYQLLSVILFKQLPDPEQKARLEKAGYLFREFPKNPYLTSN